MHFPLELDHIAIFAEIDAPEAATLEALGLTGFGGTTRHGEFGTASTSFFFENTYLELFWMHDAAAAAQNFAPVGFDAQARSQWRQSGASPFGLLFCRRSGLSEPLPFAARRLPASWMPGDVALEFAATDLAEPYIGVVPEALAYRSFRASIPEPSHALEVRRLTGVRVVMTGQKPSPVVQAVQDAGLVTVETGEAPLLELILDAGAQGKRVDARPRLPLVLAI